MKINSFLLIFTFLLITIDSSYAKEIESIVKIKPEIKYDENLKYEKIEEYKSTEEKVSVKDFDFGFDMNINREEKTIDYWKIDVKTNF